MPDHLQGLEVVPAAAGSVADDAGGDEAAVGDGGAEVGVLRAAVVGVPAQCGDGEAVAGVPGEGEGQAPGGRLHRCAPVARVQYQRLHVPVEQHTPVHMGLDVVVQGVLLVGLGERDQRHGAGHAEVGGLGRAVRVAEGGPGQDRSGEPEVGGAEAWGRADHLAPEVQRAVHRALGRVGVVVRAAEDPALPARPVAARVGGEAAVAGAGDELRVVRAVPGQ